LVGVDVVRAMEHPWDYRQFARDGSTFFLAMFHRHAYPLGVSGKPQAKRHGEKNGAGDAFSPGVGRAPTDYNGIMQLAARSKSAIRWVLPGVSLVLSGCLGGVDVTKESIAAARQRWDRAGIHDYDLEWTSAGLSRSHYVVAVRDGQVRSIRSILPDGRAFEVHPAEPRFYGVEGLFMIIADELEQLRLPTPFGQPRGAKTILRFTPDADLGYPRRYRRDVVGAPLALAIDVVRFQPQPRTRADAEPETKTPPKAGATREVGPRPEPTPAGADPSA
jgi:hypothetical protein